MDNRIYRSRFSHISDMMQNKYLFFDFELQSMFNNVKELYSTFKAVKKRFDRKETVRVSKTQAEYMQINKDLLSFPYALYNFQCKNVTIAVVQHKKHFYTYCDGFVPSHNFKYFKDGNSVGLYSERFNLVDSLNDFLCIINEYLSEKFHRLSLGVPF